MTTAITSSSGAPPTAAAGTATAAPSASVVAASLPDPSLAAREGTTDALGMLYAMMSASERAQADSAENGVKQAQAQRNVLEQQREAALRKAEEEASKGGFFKWISKDLGLGGVVGLATFNYALVAADLAAHKTGLVKNARLDVLDGAAVLVGNPVILAADVGVRKLDVTPEAVKARLDALGLGTSTPGISDDDVKPVVDRALQVNLLVVGSVGSLFTAGSTSALVVAAIGVGLSAGAFTAQVLEAPEWLTLGLEVAGLGCTLGSGFMAPAKDGVARTATALASATTNAMTGTDKILLTENQHAADEAQVNSEEARHGLMRLARVLDEIVDGMKESHESAQRAKETLQGTADTRNQTLMIASNWRG